MYWYNPNYRVKVVTPSKKVDHHKGLTADRMKKYILKHDDEEHSKLMEFYELRGLTPEGKKDEAGCPVSYGELKQWFFKKSPCKCANTYKGNPRKTNHSQSGVCSL